MRSLILTLFTGGSVGAEDVLVRTFGLETGQQSSCTEMLVERPETIFKSRLTGNLETRYSLLVIKLEAQPFGVVAQVLNACDLEIHPVLAVEDLGAVLGVDRASASVGTVVTVQTSTETGKTDADVDGGQVGLLGGTRLSGLRGLCRVLAEALLLIN